MTANETTLLSLDRTRLAATALIPSYPSGGLVLVHGGGVTRDEGGFFTRIAEGLAAVRVASIRFDLRGHGESGGRQEDLTLAGVANDVRAVAEHLATLIGQPRVSVLGASFSGGICAMLAARRPQLVDRLVLINPLLDYEKRFVDDKEYWSDSRIDPERGGQLDEEGYVAHSPSFRLGRALLNEVFWVDARAELSRIVAPTLLVHGTADTFIPVESSRAAALALRCRRELLEIPGAQHGVAVPDDPGYRDPQTRRWQEEVVGRIGRWLT